MPPEEAGVPPPGALLEAPAPLEDDALPAAGAGVLAAAGAELELPPECPRRATSQITRSRATAARAIWKGREICVTHPPSAFLPRELNGARVIGHGAPAIGGGRPEHRSADGAVKRRFRAFSGPAARRARQ